MEPVNWDDYAQTWDQNEGARAYAQAAFASLERVCAEHDHSLAGSRVLDFGCGTGLLTEILATRGAAVVAVDRSAGMIDVLTQKIIRLGLKNVTAAQGSAPPAGPFDLIVCSSVCAFVEDYPGMVRGFVNTLRPGGLFVQWDWEYDEGDEEPFGLTRSGVGDVLRGAGFEHVTVETGFSLEHDGKRMSPLMGVGRSPRAGAAS